jgi:hypothetical protein
MNFNQFAKLVFPNTLSALEAVLAYDGIGQLRVYHELENGLGISEEIEFELGETPWSFLIKKDFVTDVKQLNEKLGNQEISLAFDKNGKTLSLLPADSSGAIALLGGLVEQPNWQVKQKIQQTQVTPEEWGIIEAVASLAYASKYKEGIHNGVNIRINGNQLEVVGENRSSQKKPGLMMSQVFTFSKTNGKPREINIIVPVDAILYLNDGNTPVTLEIGGTQILMTQGSKRVLVNLIEGDYPPIGLVPDGTAQADIVLEKLKSVLYPDGADKPPLDGKEKIALKATYKDGTLLIVPPSGKGARKVAITMPADTNQKECEDKTFIVYASLLLDIIRLASVAASAHILIGLPIGLQFLTITAGTVRFVLPTLVQKTKNDMTAKELASPVPIIQEATTTTLNIGSEENPDLIEMTVEAVEDLPDEVESASEHQALTELLAAKKEGQRLLKALPKKKGASSKAVPRNESVANKVGTVLEQPDLPPEEAMRQLKEAVGADSSNEEIESAGAENIQNLVEDANSVLQQADNLPPNGVITLRECPLSPKDISGLARAIMRQISRMEEVILDFRTMQIRFTFTKIQ